MALVFDYVSFGIPLGSLKGKSVEVNMMWGEGRLWTPSLGLCKDIPQCPTSAFPRLQR